MDLDEIKRILEILREHDLSEFEIEYEGLRLRIKKNGVVVAAPAMSAAPAPPAVAAASAQPAPVALVAEGRAPDETSDLEFAVVKSPIVGTFYRAPEPGAPPFTEVGAQVKKGQVLCIIEAMKLMNEIESEYEGEVVKVYVENGQPVQYGERLFAIRAR
jgi:acetyl-CoA carboxylase biotin carboxyl carrier protein